MPDNSLHPPMTMPAGRIVALAVDADTYLRDYAATCHEWVDGTVIDVTPVSLDHNNLLKYLLKLFDAYFAVHPSGQTLIQPFVMRLAQSFREPDVMLVLHTNPHELSATALYGAADVCIEIVSAESVSRDYGDKLVDYEQAGVNEYWIIDPLRQITTFYRLQAHSHYSLQQPLDDVYTTPLLPKFQLNIARLWDDPLPDFFAIGAMIKAMFEA